MYSLRDYEEAKAELEQWKKRWENYSGNNPNKYQADIKAVRRKLELIESALKKDGLLAVSEKEQLADTLDAAFPNADNKEIVSFEGKRYMRRFYPLEKSRTGKTVTEWGKSWELVSGEHR
ncbi:MAG: hypothetical protein ACOY5C_12270 [Pseudomonadota bacterium]